MEKTTCDFCHRDNSDDMEKICGKLHVQKFNDKYIAAHHKCMQYSAQLIQYKFDHFGGFEVDMVMEEIKRGTYLKCTICKRNRGKRKNKSKDGYNVNGATAGCALLRCRKTYHYCCAYSDPTVKTKRIESQGKEDGQGKEFMYIVSCCLDHEKKSELPFQAGTNSSSESSSEDDDDVDEDDNDEEEVSRSDSDIEGINNNDVCTPDNSDRFNSCINDISALSQDESKSPQENINASAMEDTEHTAGMFDQLRYDESSDDDIISTPDNSVTKIARSLRESK